MGGIQQNTHFVQLVNIGRSHIIPHNQLINGFAVNKLFQNAFVFYINIDQIGDFYSGLL